MVLLISYDLNGHERPASYADVKAYIERHAAASIRPLYSQWLVETTAGPEAWAKAMIDGGLIDSNDALLICQLRRPYQGWLDAPCWPWLNARV